MNSRYYVTQNIYDGNRYIIVGVRNEFEHSASPRYLVFDKRNLSDGFSALGPEGVPGIFIDGIEFTPMYVRDNRLVGYMQALDIVDNAAAISNPDLKALAATLKEDSNPVIVTAKLK